MVSWTRQEASCAKPAAPWSLDRIAEHPDFEGAFVSTVWHPSAAGSHREGRAFLESYRRAYAEEPGPIAALTYDAVGLLLAAVRESGGEDPQAIREALADVEGYRGATGAITFRGTEGDPRKQALILAVRGGGVEFLRTVSP